MAQPNGGVPDAGRWTPDARRRTLNIEAAKLRGSAGDACVAAMLSVPGFDLSVWRLASGVRPNEGSSGEQLPGAPHKQKRLPVGSRFCLCGAPGRIRTCDPLVRSQILYPTELPVRKSSFAGGRERLRIIPNGPRRVKPRVVNYCAISPLRSAFVSEGSFPGPLCRSGRAGSPANRCALPRIPGCAGTGRG